MEEIKPKINVTIYTESNPNPNSLKFVVNFMLMPEGMSADFPDPISASRCPLALDLFRYNFVRRVFISSNFVTVTKDEGIEWNEIVLLLKPFIKGYLEEGNPLFLEEIASDINENDPEVVKKIKGILDEYVRPAVESDGGNITFHSFNEGVVKVHLQGSCSGCPSSTATLKGGIERLLTSMLPEVKEVVAEGV
ncbi:MAG: NifU family protein [Bacteroidota bacterium]|nr:NifU family protein [Bacteroidota bacterium]